jgi:hypothetical protein
MLLAALGQVASQSYKLSSCEVQHVEVDVNKVKRKVVQTEQMAHDLCHKIDPPKKNPDMAADCRAFCSVGGEDVAFPVQLGGEYYGFDLPTVKDICTRIFEGDATGATVCVDNSLAFFKMQLATSYYLAAVERFENEQLIFSAEMEQRSAKLSKSFKDPMFIDDMD